MQKTRWFKFDQSDYAPPAPSPAGVSASGPGSHPPTPAGLALPWFKKLLVLLIAGMPGNALRIWLYRTLLGYDIDYQSRVGMFNYLCVHHCQLRGARIGAGNLILAQQLVMAPGALIYRFNRIQDAHVFRLGAGSVIRSRNSFVATTPGATPFKHLENFSSGRRCLITNGHFFDLSDSIQLGDSVTFGGLGSQVWTHGVSVDRVRIQAPVELASHIYIGSRCLIVQGVRIGERVVIGAGTVVSRSLAPGGFYVSSHLQRKGDFQEYAQHPARIQHRGNSFLRISPD